MPCRCVLQNSRVRRFWKYVRLSCIIYRASEENKAVSVNASGEVIYVIFCPLIFPLPFLSNPYNLCLPTSRRHKEREIEHITIELFDNDDGVVRKYRMASSSPMG